MLRDGYFIKEDPPRIGAHYIPQFYTRATTPEERLIQDIVLSAEPYRTSVFTKFLGKILAI